MRLARLVIVGGMFASVLAVGGCALLGGFDFVGYSAASDGGLVEERDPAANRIDADDGAEGAEAKDSAKDGDATLTVDAELDRVAAEETPPPVGGGVDASSDAPVDAPTCPTDDDNCGRCGHGCQGGHCLGGRCQPVTIIAGYVSAFAVNASTVYWDESTADASGTTIMRMPLTGGPPSSLSSGANTSAIVLDSTNVYWLGGDGIHTAFLDSPGGYWTFDSFTSSVDSLRILAVDRTNLYTSRIFPYGPGSGCATTQIDVAPLNPSATGMTWTNGVCNTMHIAVDGTNVYWTDVGTRTSYAHPAVWQQPADGGAATMLAPAQFPIGLGVHGGAIYWTDSGSGQVLRLTLGTSSGPAILATSSSPGELAVDPSGVYWIDGGNYAADTIMHVPLAGGAVETLASAYNMSQITTNSTSVFWLENMTSTDGAPVEQVMMLAK
jgi:hypothetical protein